MTDTPTPTLLSPLISATVLADTIGPDGQRLTTLELVYPRFIHSELMTHRVFSRNASSSRAIPVKRALQMIRDNPAVPYSWRLNQPGMQGYEVAGDAVAQTAQGIWISAMIDAIKWAERMDALGIHKQTVNRITEPFSHIKVVLSSTYWANWDGLRDHPAADPTIEALAKAVVAARAASTPVLRQPGDWHLPYVSDEERGKYRLDTLLKMSAARCARTSYNNHDGSTPDVDKDIKLHDMLVASQPVHASPTEHQASPDFRNEAGEWVGKHLWGNFGRFVQYRKTISSENLETDTF